MTKTPQEQVQDEFPDHHPLVPWTEEMNQRWWELVEGDYPYQAKLAMGVTNPKALEEAGTIKGDMIYHPQENNVAYWGFQSQEDLDAFVAKTGATKL